MILFAGRPCLAQLPSYPISITSLLIFPLNAFGNSKNHCASEQRADQPEHVQHGDKPDWFLCSLSSSFLLMPNERKGKVNNEVTDIT